MITKDLTCGFFNSVDGDRKYNADDMARPYHRIISNGVFSDPNGHEPTDFKVSVATGNLDVLVQSGEGMFADKWTELETAVELEALSMYPADNVLDRIDSVIIRIDNSPSVRKGILMYVVGTPSSNPVHPTITRTADVSDYRLADIIVRANMQYLTSSDIIDTRASSDCGYATHLLSSRALIRSYRSLYTTTVQDETTIPINITQYSKELDILQVYINGLMLVEETEYTINADGTQITLTKPVDRNTPIHFVVYKSIDSTNAESIVGNVEMLRDLLIINEQGGAKKRVNSNESVLNAFVGLGVGFHTMYSETGATDVPKEGAYRYFGHMTGSNTGYIFAMSTAGSIYTNYLFSGAWRGWKAVYEVTPSLLYSSTTGVFPNPNVTITPSKPLSDCKNGWILTFSGYDDSTKQAKDYYVQTITIPKRCYNNERWNGERMTFPFVYYATESTMSMCVKSFDVYNDRIVSTGNNSVGVQRNLVLRSVHEY